MAQRLAHQRACRAAKVARVVHWPGQPRPPLARPAAHHCAPFLRLFRWCAPLVRAEPMAAGGLAFVMGGKGMAFLRVALWQAAPPHLMPTDIPNPPLR